MNKQEKKEICRMINIYAGTTAISFCAMFNSCQHNQYLSAYEKFGVNALASSIVAMSVVLGYASYKVFRHGTALDKAIAGIGIAAVIIECIML
jgi:hypothetical protein